MLSSDDNESRQQKNNLQHTFLVHFFGVVLHDYNEAETSQLQPLLTRFMEKMSCVHVCTPVPFFFFLFAPATEFSPWWQLQAFIIFSSPLLIFFCISSNEIGLLCFFYLSLQPFLYYPRQQGHRLLTCGRFSQNQKPKTKFSTQWHSSTEMLKICLRPVDRHKHLAWALIRLNLL